MNKYKTALLILGLSLPLLSCDNNEQDEPINIGHTYSNPLLADAVTSYQLNMDDMILGDVNAPVEIIEYSALTCSHCRSFHKNIFPELEKKYIETGKVKVIFRSFLLNPFDVAPTSLSRCLPKGKYFPFVSALFEQQAYWNDQDAYLAEEEKAGSEPSNMGFSDFSRKRIDEIIEELELDKASLKACAAQSETMEYNLIIQKEGIDKYEIHSTPSLVLNGQIVEFETFEELAEAIDKHL